MMRRPAPELSVWVCGPMHTGDGTIVSYSALCLLIHFNHLHCLKTVSNALNVNMYKYNGGSVYGRISDEI